MDFWRWHDQWTPQFPVSGEFGGQSPYPTFAKNWQSCNTINGNEDWIDLRFENNLTNSGNVSITVVATGSPIFAANSNTAPTAVGEDLTGVAKGRIPLSATRSYDYDSSGLVPTNLSDTLSSNWSCVSAPTGCGALSIRQPTKLFTWVDGATLTGTYTFTFGVTDGSLTDTDTVTITVANVSASIGDSNCFVDEPCLIDASASTGWDSIYVDLGENVPGSSLKYNMRIPRSAHRYHAAGSYTVTVTAKDAQSLPVSSIDTGVITVTARTEANAANTEDLTNAANVNFISAANCLGDPTGNLTKIQNAIDIAKNRNTVSQKIIVPLGCRANGTLTAKAPVGNEQITFTTSGSLPASHTRIASDGQLFIIRAILANTSALVTDPAGGSHHYKFRGIVFETSVQQHSIVLLGQADVEDTTSEISHHFILQHCIVRPTDEFSVNVSNGIIVNANDVAIIDSRVEKLSFSGVESHNILSYSTEGRHAINNNYLGGSSIPLFYGGAMTTVRGMVPKDISFRENYITRPLEWKTSHPSWDGKVRAIKNLWELKTGSNIVSSGNILENNWTDAQAGIGIHIQATCDSGNWAQAFNIDFSYNHARNTEQGVEFRASEYRGIVQSKKAWFYHNLLEGLTSRTYTFIQAAEIRINHCTATSGQSAIFDGEMRTPAFVYENSITVEGAFGWFGSGAGIGLAGLNVYTPSHIFRDSLQIGGSSGNYGAPISGMQFPADQAVVGFTNPASSNWSLLASSPFKGDANDGTDPGVNWTDLQIHLAGTTTGIWSSGPLKCNWHTLTICN